MWGRRNVGLGGHCGAGGAPWGSMEQELAPEGPVSPTEQMGRILQRTAISTNIKERLDFSCALFGPDGGLVSNAPHIPVHLGAMQEAVQFQARLWDTRDVTGPWGGGRAKGSQCEPWGGGGGTREPEGPQRAFECLERWQDPRKMVGTLGR